MRGHTHALFGVTTLVAANALTDFVQPHPVEGLPTGPVLCAGAAILGALAPDLDAGQSTIQGELGLAGSVIRGGLGLLGVKHRGMLHSGLAALLVLAAGWLLGGRWGYADVGLAFGLGYLSHVALADAMTITGVPLCWPLSRRFHLLPRPLRVRTGGPAEWLVFLLAGAALAWLLSIQPALFAEVVTWLKGR